MPIELMPHQEKVVEELSNGKVLYGPLGSGKSIAVLAYYMKNEKPKDIYVITTAKKRDKLEWEGDAAAFGIGTNRGATVAGVIHVDSWNNVGKYIDREDAFFIFDEQRVVGTGAWVKAFLKITRKNNWILLSATPGDTWPDYAPIFIANNFYRNITEFRQEHLVYAPRVKFPKIIRYMNVDTLEKYRNIVLVEMKYPKHTKSHDEITNLEYDEAVVARVTKDRWNIFTDEPIVDISELCRVVRRIVNSDKSRINRVRELIETHPRVIIFYNFNYELDILRELSDVVTVAEWNGHRKQNIPETERWVYLVQYMAGAEGWNCTDTDAMIFYSMTYSYKMFHQAKGRIDRLNTDYVDLYYYIFLSGAWIDKAIWNCIKHKKLFNERAFAKRNGMF